MDDNGPLEDVDDAEGIDPVDDERFEAILDQAMIDYRSMLDKLALL